MIVSFTTWHPEKRACTWIGGLFILKNKLCCSCPNIYRCFMPFQNSHEEQFTPRNSYTPSEFWPLKHVLMKNQLKKLCLSIPASIGFSIHFVFQVGAFKEK